MATILESRVVSSQVNVTRSIWKTLIIGLILGVAYLVMVNLFLRADLTIDVSGNLATIITAVLGLILLVIYRIQQPLIIAVAVAISLWGLASLTDGLSNIEVVIGTLILYILSYGLFYWITRYVKIGAVLISTLIVVIAMRLIAS